jgi:formamidopyrimidine-DNA glycosylase
MPELPEIAVYKKYVDATSLHKKITEVEFGDELLFDVSKKELYNACVGKEFTESERIGKHLLIHVEDNDWMSLHFGMTGGLKYFKDKEDRPDYIGLLLRFNNGFHLAFTCPRKFGRIGMTERPEQFREDKNLGPDALEIDKDRFVEIFKEKRGMLKSALMDQKTICGIGNIYSDEILFQANMHPESQVQNLSESELEDLYDVMQEVLSTCIDKGAQYSEYPDNYIIPNREEGSSCPKCDGTIAKIKVSGRSTYYCASHQKK